MAGLDIFVEPVEFATSKGYVKRYTIRSKTNGKNKGIGKPMISQSKAIDAAKSLALKHEQEHPYHPESKTNVALFIEGGRQDGAWMTIKGKFVEFRNVP